MVASFCQLLTEVYGDQLDPQGRQWLAFAVDGAQRMQTLIRDLLEFSRVGTRARPLQDLDLSECAASAMRDLALSVEVAGAEVEIESLPEVHGDYAQLQQVLQNLLSNAVKFRRQDVTPRICVSAEPDGELWRVSVSDNGIGFDPRHAENIFGLFKRLESRETYPGTGIGLAICERIIERHQGRIWAESQQGEGTTFHFTVLGAVGEEA